MTDKRNTRVAVPLSPEMYDAVSLLSRHAGMSRGRYLADALKPIEPSMLRLVSILQHLDEATEAEREHVLHVLERVEKALEYASQAATDGIGRADVGATGRAESAPADRPSGAKRQPPYNNMGVPSEV